eukprot:696440-Amphidinium_carterae.1
MRWVREAEKNADRISERLWHPSHWNFSDWTFSSVGLGHFLAFHSGYIATSSLSILCPFHTSRRRRRRRSWYAEIFPGGWTPSQARNDWQTLRASTLRSSREHKLVRGDLAGRLDAGKVFHPCASWHALRAVPELHPGAIVSQTEPPAAQVEDILYSPIALCCHNCAPA